MVDGKIGKHAFDCFKVSSSWCREIVVKLFIKELNVRDSFNTLRLTSRLSSNLFSAVRNIGAIGFRASGESSELHDVRGQCAGIVRENVRDLTKLFVQVR